MAEHGTMMFDYERPADWATAGRLLSEPGSLAKMGGCDVLTRFRSGRLRARLVVGLKRLPGVDELSFGADGVRIGAAVTLAKLTREAEFQRNWPVFAQVIARIGSPAIRTSATVVGNVAQGWGVGDLVPLLEVCDAELDIRGPSGQRRTTVVDYAKTEGDGALKPGEVIVALMLKKPADGARTVYERFTFKQGFDLPLVSVAVQMSIKNDACGNVKVSAVGGSPMPARCAEVEAVLNGNRIDGRSIEAAVTAISKWADPPDDFRASAAYRRHVLGTMLRRALAKLAAA
jgi:CO/xanthine dehydrogenase FAD-binding subunit